MMMFASSADVLPPLKQEIAERTVTHFASSFRLEKAPFAGAIYASTPSASGRQRACSATRRQMRSCNISAPVTHRPRLAPIIVRPRKQGTCPSGAQPRRGLTRRHRAQRLQASRPCIGRTSLRHVLRSGARPPRALPSSRAIPAPGRARARGHRRAQLQREQRRELGRGERERQRLWGARARCHDRLDTRQAR